MELFSRDEIRTYVESKQNDLEREIRGFSDQQICTCDLEEWADFFRSKYCIDPIVLYEDSIEQVLSETQSSNITHGITMTLMSLSIFLLRDIRLLSKFHLMEMRICYIYALKLL